MIVIHKNRPVCEFLVYFRYMSVNSILSEIPNFYRKYIYYHRHYSTVPSFLRLELTHFIGECPLVSDFLLISNALLNECP